MSDLHDLEHLPGVVRIAVGEERDEQRHVVHGLEVRPNVLDAPRQLGPVRQVEVERVRVGGDGGVAAVRGQALKIIINRGQNSKLRRDNSKTTPCII